MWPSSSPLQDQLVSSLNEVDSAEQRTFATMLCLIAAGNGFMRSLCRLFTHLGISPDVVNYDQQTALQLAAAHGLFLSRTLEQLSNNSRTTLSLSNNSLSLSRTLSLSVYKHTINSFFFMCDNNNIIYMCNIYIFDGLGQDEVVRFLIYRGLYSLASVGVCNNQKFSLLPG
jgi:hypothetical protein